MIIQIIGWIALVFSILSFIASVTRFVNSVDRIDKYWAAIAEFQCILWLIAAILCFKDFSYIQIQKYEPSKLSDRFPGYYCGTHDCSLTVPAPDSVITIPNLKKE